MLSTTGLRWAPAFGVIVASALAALQAPTTAATSWSVSVQSLSSAQSASGHLPAAPSSVAAACTSALSDTVKVTWGAVAGAGSYGVYDSDTSASGPYSSAASGLTGTSWTSPGLATGDYWFEVTARVGESWQSTESSATTESVVVGPPATACVEL